MKQYLDIISKLENTTPNTSGVNRTASILIPLIERNGEIHILYERRALHLNSQPGEICFPGGKIESLEKSCETALRETCEELNLEDSEVTLIGRLDSILTSFDMIIHCYIGKISRSFESIQFSKSEVDSIFTVPLSVLRTLPPKIYHVKTKMELPADFPFSNIPNGKDYNFRNTVYPIVFYYYDHYIIWGLTARMTKNFIDMINDIEF
ncbi:NUDIX hydrolase [Fusibacter ferrireducens]|uniref:CoA pyrophosphatase n=1 Tax=Fusibacter ferrireducens TaxID=2785058 RepID=A0ABR9ZQM4_9FIRM|nr:CoA pyrophosphatase [Fusibacter ferrireducens]MBF4692765.1 CoA pyrophosphatase [Fusibacter ferrireducens]